MKIRIRDIVSGGIKGQYSVTPAEIGLADEVCFKPEDLLKVAAELLKFDGFVLATVDVTFIAEHCCARCLEPLRVPGVKHFEVELEFNPGDEWLDLAGSVREELLMETWPRVLCREDCKGICPDCGADLNKEPCQCSKRSK